MDSKTYWKLREEENQRHYIVEEEEYKKQLMQIYQDMLDSCQTQINDFYGRYAAKEGITLAEAKKRVSKLDIEKYERKAKRYVRDKDFSDKANEEMRFYNATMKINRLEMLKANIGLELISGHDELEKFMAGILKGRTEEELNRQAGILGKTIRNNAKTANAIVNGSFRVSKVGEKSTFSDYIWQYQDLMREDLGKILATGLIQGKNSRALAKDLHKYWYGSDPKTGGGATYCMERLMRTELARVQIEAQKQSYERNGFDQYMFITNSKCCDACQALNGKHFKVKDMMPGENAPPLHPNCRCSTAAYFDRNEYDEWLESLSKGENELTPEQKYKQNESNIRKTLQSVEEERRGLDYEVGTIIDLDGNIINVTSGQSHSVSPPEELLKGNIFTHNHPGGGCFSQGDIESFVSSGLFELRASTPQGTYYSLRVKDGETINADIVKGYNTATNVSKMCEAIREDFKSGKISGEKARDFTTVLEYKTIYGEKFLEEEAGKYGLIFERGTING